MFLTSTAMLFTETKSHRFSSAALTDDVRGNGARETDIFCATAHRDGGGSTPIEERGGYTRK